MTKTFDDLTPEEKATLKQHDEALIQAADNLGSYVANLGPEEKIQFAKQQLADMKSHPVLSQEKQLIEAMERVLAGLIAMHK